MSEITIIGIVGNEVEVRYTNTGKAVAKFPMSIYQGKEKESMWIDVVAWNALAESCGNELKKGTKEKDFIRYLLDSEVVFRQGRELLPFAQYHHKGFFEVKTGEKFGHAYHQTKFTPKGIAWIAGKVDKYAS
jgi:hypothetical protein